MDIIFGNCFLSDIDHSILQYNMSSSNIMLVLRGTLEGHNGWVTSLSTSAAQPNLLVSGSRDKTLISWKLTENEQQFGVPVRSYKGHSHIVQDVVVSADGNYAVSASWDKTLRLWNLATGNSEARFVGHTGDVLSVAIDANSSKIISASRDKTIRVWNTVGDCAYVLLGHTDWVTKVRVAPKNLEEGEADDGRITFVSAGMDKIVRVCAFFFLLSLFTTNMSLNNAASRVIRLYLLLNSLLIDI